MLLLLLPLLLTAAAAVLFIFMRVKVCRYHTSYYRPDNLCLVVTGQVEPEHLFNALGAIEDKIISKVWCACVVWVGGCGRNIIF